jgi:NAD(P)-dependent dehydrogenase (short-subunit alcohol dehydrogenase family)
MILNNKTALITGGTDGIGKASAKKLLSEGYSVVIVGRDRQKCEDTLKELKETSGNDHITFITAELSLMNEVKKAAETFLAEHRQLDLLFLCANSFKTGRTETKEGFEWHFALGYLSKALLILLLENALKAAPGSSILTIGVPYKSKINYGDLNFKKKFSIYPVIMQFWWAVQLFSREFNFRSFVPMNVCYPGIVRTKIMDTMPQPMKFLTGLGYYFLGMTVEKSAENISGVIRDITENGRKGEFYDVTKIAKNPADDSSPGESEKLWELTEELLKPYR